MELYGKLTFEKPSVLVLFLCCLLLFLGLGALGGGILMMISPDGALLGMNPAWLENTPFTSYLIPGLILLTCMGLLPVISCYGLWFQPDWDWTQKLNIYPDRHWSWTFSLYSGIIVIIWIVVQQIMTQYFWLQPVMTATGLLITVFTLIPEVMQRYEGKPHSKP